MTKRAYMSHRLKWCMRRAREAPPMWLWTMRRRRVFLTDGGKDTQYGHQTVPWAWAGGRGVLSWACCKHLQLPEQLTSVCEYDLWRKTLLWNLCLNLASAAWEGPTERTFLCMRWSLRSSCGLWFFNPCNVSLSGGWRHQTKSDANPASMLPCFFNNSGNNHMW